jgi:acyl-CoA reductase-like NAD-dependent aldehyde dehydrogenase
MSQRSNLFINGEYIKPGSGEYFEVTNPADLSVIGLAAKGNRSDCQNALEAAENASSDWAILSNTERGNIMEACIAKMKPEIERIGKLLNQEHGKPITDALGEVNGSLYYLKFFAEEAKRIHGELPAAKSASTKSIVYRQPRGIVAAISPWNYPLALSAWKVGSALAAGCTVVLKPPSDTPLSVNKFFGEFSIAGLPPGVLNIITGPSSEIGDELINNPMTKVIAFTGSTQTGKAIAKKVGGSLKKLILELGGQTPLVVFKDADLNKAVPQAVKRSFRNMGQICNAVNRIYVENEIADVFINAFVDVTNQLKVGFGSNRTDYDLGPMTNLEGIERVQRHVADAVDKGGTILTGGARPDDTALPEGYFYQPTTITNVTDDMLVMREETFGPVVGIDTFSGIDEAVAKANSTRYGLVCYAFTSNLKTAYAFMERAEFGSVGINTVSPDSPYAPYPAWKESGLGVELGHFGVEEFTQLKHCILDVT